jgi:hypothetical protein
MISNAVAAVIGVAVAVALTVGLALLKLASGDPTIQPEGEPDPGKRA